jgi:hypothetical protein
MVLSPRSLTRKPRVLVAVGITVVVLIVALVADEFLYTKVYIPWVRSSLTAELNSQTDKAALSSGKNLITWFASQAISDDCVEAYYGCLDWRKFSGSQSVLSINDPSSGDNYGIELLRTCPRNERCVHLPTFDSYGILIDKESFFDRLRSLNTSRSCNEVTKYRWHIYLAKLCRSDTLFDGKLVSSSYGLEFDQTMVGRVLGLPVSIGIPIYTINWGTRSVYIEK